MDRKQAEIQINQMNSVLEPILRAEWELTHPFQRLGLRNKPGPKPEWKWTEANGKLLRKANRGGIDWWRYQTVVLTPKLIPFAQFCQINRPKTIVQEDKAPSHSHHAQVRVYTTAQVERLLWCGNSADLNAIEPAWFHLKRETTKKGAPASLTVARTV